jgi:FdhD protein
MAAGHRVARDGTRQQAQWAVPEERPVALLYNGEQFGVMMLTPADLEDFALGFSLTEGIAQSPGDIEAVRLEQTRDGHLVNVIMAADKVAAANDRRRSILAGSACGICGAQTIEAALPRLPKVSGALPEPRAILDAIAALAVHQPMNAENRSTHAAAFCAREGRIELVREDIGRHNALDKLAGAIARAGLDPKSGFILLSSRLSVEMATKAARIGVPLVASISAPSDLALQRARQAGLSVAARSGDELMIFEGAPGP